MVYREPQFRCEATGRRPLARSVPWLLAAALSHTSAFAHEAGNTLADARVASPTPNVCEETSIVPANCNSLEDCFAALISQANPGPTLGADEEAIAAAIQHWGARAVPRLIELLEHENLDVAELAGYALRDIDGLKEQHLDALIAAYRRGNEWMPVAIARIGSRRAIEFLAIEFRRTPYREQQFAMEQLGTQAIPHLVALYEDCSECSSQVFSAASAVFFALDSKARSAVSPLVRIASDRTRSTPTTDGSSERTAVSGVASSCSSAMTASNRRC